MLECFGGRGQVFASRWLADWLRSFVCGGNNGNHTKRCQQGKLQQRQQQPR